MESGLNIINSKYIDCDARYRVHKRSKTVPLLRSYQRLQSSRYKYSYYSSKLISKNGLLKILFIIITILIVIDMILRYYGIFFFNTLFFSTQSTKTDGENINFEILRSTFEHFNKLDSKSISLVQMSNGIGVISNRFLSSRSKIYEINFESILYSRSNINSLQKRIKADIERGKISDIVGLMVLLLKHKKIGTESPLYNIIRILPPTDWYTENGLFSMSKTDFDVASYGTTMQGIYADAEKHCNSATSYIYSIQIKRELGLPLTADHSSRAPITQADVQWAYMIIRTYSLSIENSLAFIPPTLFIRKVNKVSSIRIEIDKEEDNKIIKGISIYTLGNIQKGEEIVFEDFKGMTDAEIYVNRGFWLLPPHRMVMPVVYPLNLLSDDENLQKSLQILHDFNCSLNYTHYYQIEQNIPLLNDFIHCLKIIALIRSKIPSEILLNNGQNLLGKPSTQKCEVDAATIGISIIQQKIDKLRSSALKVIDHFGHRTTLELPVIKVREAEMTILKDIIKILHNWYNIVSDADTYEAYYFDLFSSIQGFEN
ncbi:hypothetical protein cand_019350 [Cryptosporidium andersoni]|uniref:SET domain-containing protein n=1 Tax=Cryptosporidium andersoni TaxID=117008 RepID=A0A1J4MH29_9CRYT|nr:hypothetical protein cand_019350 [Cryptosporidium andersoni]